MENSLGMAYHHCRLQLKDLDLDLFKNHLLKESIKDHKDWKKVSIK